MTTKANLYTRIQSDVNVTVSLKKWLYNIFTFCYNHEINIQLLGSIDPYFPTSSPSDSTSISGYISITQDVIKSLFDSKTPLEHANQRVILTTIYRFSRVFASLLWNAIVKLGREDLSKLSVDEVNRCFGGCLDVDELRRHMQFTLHKHGVITNTTDSEDPAKLLYTSFVTEPSTFVSELRNLWPSILTSVTQPVGTNPVSVWMIEYRADQTRLTNNPRNDNMKVTEERLRTYGAPLCELERRQGANPQLWLTGGMLYHVNPNSQFANMAAQYGKRIITGPSSTTQMMLDCALLFGIDVHHALLSIIPWMDVCNDHTPFEILLAANAYLPFDQYLFKNNMRSGVDNDEDEITFLSLIARRALVAQQTGGEKKRNVRIVRSVKAASGGKIEDDVGDDIQQRSSVAPLLADEWFPVLHVEMIGEWYNETPQDPEANGWEPPPIEHKTYYEELHDRPSSFVSLPTSFEIKDDHSSMIVNGKLLQEDLDKYIDIQNVVETSSSSPSKGDTRVVQMALQILKNVGDVSKTVNYATQDSYISAVAPAAGGKSDK